MKTIFWNVDTQYDFMRNDPSFKGALPVPDARSIEGNLEQLTKYARLHTLRIINTADWHTAASAELSSTPDYKTTFPPHCLQKTIGAAFVPATAPYAPHVVDWQDKVIYPSIIALAKEIILYKDKFCIFAGNPHTEKVLETIKPDRAVVYGVATNVCVHYAVMGLLERGVEVVVVEDAIKELPNLPLEETINQWTAKGAKLVKTKDVVEGRI